MFGILVAGKLPLNNFQRVSETQFLIQVPDIEQANHIVVFMTGEMPFPDGFAGAVYFNYSTGSESQWIYLGKISNHKPSAIFKISNLKQSVSHSSLGSSSFGQSINTLGLAQLGISVEPISQIDALTPATDTQTVSADSSLEFGQKMLQNFYNYASSFAKDGPDGQQYFSLDRLTAWFENFKRRLEMNPNFWKSS